MNEIEGGNAKGRPPVKWRDRERGERSLRDFEWAMRECLDIESWELFCRGQPLVGAPRNRRQ